MSIMVSVDLKERQKSILSAVIQEYIDTALPVASGQIAERLDFPFSPATIRNDFLELDRLGYLSQPHVSAGRIPTDKGYRFFVDGILEVAEIKKHDQALLLDTESQDGFIKTLAKNIADLSREFAVAGFPDEDLFYKSGFAKVLEEPEFNDYALRRDFAELLDSFEEIIEDFFDADDSGGPKVFIGGENPIKSARNYSMIFSSFETPFKKRSVISIIGPKRMDYKNNISLLCELKEIVRKLS